MADLTRQPSLPEVETNPTPLAFKARDSLFLYRPPPVQVQLPTTKIDPITGLPQKASLSPSKEVGNELLECSSESEDEVVDDVANCVEEATGETIIDITSKSPTGWKPLIELENTKRRSSDSLLAMSKKAERPKRHTTFAQSPTAIEQTDVFSVADPADKKSASAAAASNKACAASVRPGRHTTSGELQTQTFVLPVATSETSARPMRHTTAGDEETEAFDLPVTASKMSARPTRHTTPGEVKTEVFDPPVASSKTSGRPARHTTFGELQTQTFDPPVATSKKSTRPMRHTTSGEMPTNVFDPPVASSKTPARPTRHTTSGEMQTNVLGPPIASIKTSAGRPMRHTTSGEMQTQVFDAAISLDKEAARARPMRHTTCYGDMQAEVFDSAAATPSKKPSSARSTRYIASDDPSGQNEQQGWQAFRKLRSMMSAPWRKDSKTESSEKTPSKERAASNDGKPTGKSTQL